MPGRPRHGAKTTAVRNAHFNQAPALATSTRPRRRSSVALLVMTSVLAQDLTRPRRVGILMSGLAADPATRQVLQALVDGLRERGWQEGRNVMLEARYAGPDPARFPELAAELVALKVDVITTANTQALDAAAQR
jgi:hypothetical protein